MKCYLQIPKRQESQISAVTRRIICILVQMSSYLLVQRCLDVTPADGRAFLSRLTSEAECKLHGSCIRLLCQSKLL